MKKSCKKKLLYIMGIDWGWIYQRPQIIERHLEEEYDVTVVFPRSILKLFTRFQVKYPQNYRVLWTLPLQERNVLIGNISRLLNRHVFRGLNRYETVVIGYPLYYRYISKRYSGFLIYDCMDNYETLYCYPAGVPEVLYQEKQLISHCNLVFVSSKKLEEKLRKYDVTFLPPIILMRNGTDIPDTLPPVARSARKTRYQLGYVGTIAEWFDQNLIYDSLLQQDDIECHLIGPISITLPSHPRLIVEGIVPHHLLRDTVRSYSCLIMPFRLEETVLYVDPVKLYEYIVMGKCIISIYYPEIERFRDFVYFYQDSSDFIQLLSFLKSEGFPPKYTSIQRRNFLENNSWKTRFCTWDQSVNAIRQHSSYISSMHGGENEC